MPIKNVVFDVGNVLLKWDPVGIINHCFPDHPDIPTLATTLFRSDTWMDLNKGLLTIDEIIAIYHQKLPELTKPQLEHLFYVTKQSLTPIAGSLELLEQLYQRQIPLYSITDNVKEIMRYLRNRYDFWHKFNHIVVSADIGYLKPAKEIYLYLLQQNQLNPKETLFIDDHLPNIIGAEAVGMQAWQFTDAMACERLLKQELVL